MRPPQSGLRRPQLCFSSLLRLEGETDGGWLPGSNRYILRLGSVSFLPGRQRVGSWRDVIQLESATVVALPEGAFDYRNVSVHPRMNVALDGYGNFLVVPGRVERLGARRLRLVPRGVFCGLRVNVVRSLVGIHDLHVLTRIDDQYMREVLTTFLL